jgi:hypothetical protein
MRIRSDFRGSLRNPYELEKEADSIGSGGKAYRRQQAAQEGDDKDAGHVCSGDDTEHLGSARGHAQSQTQCAE